MHRTALLTLLQTYKPQSSDDERNREEILRFVRENPDCFLRSLLTGHITASAWILDPTWRYVLLTHHKKLHKWLQPGGHCDGDPDVLSVAIKEAQEETGIVRFTPALRGVFDLDIHSIPARQGKEGFEPEHLHYDIRFVLQAGTTSLQLSEESHALAWVAIKDLQNKTNDVSVVRMREKWLNLQRTMLSVPEFRTIH